MEISKEDIAAFELRQKRNREKNERHRYVKALYDNNKLSELSIAWHLDPLNIDLSLQKDHLDERLLDQGFSIIPEVEIETLFDNMIEGNPQMFREKKLFNPDMIDTNISSVIDFWLKGEKLIPPTITVLDQTLATSLNISFTTSDKLFPTDGKHRINVAYYFEATKIPILVVNKQLVKIKQILNLNN